MTRLSHGLIFLIIGTVSVSGFGLLTIEKFFADLVSPNQIKIINGWNAVPGQFPYHVLIEGVTSNGKSNLCGGSIISDSHILTAAHCIDHAAYVIVEVGVTKRYLYPGKYRKSQSLIVHPQWDARGDLENDIGIIRVSPKLTFDAYVQPIQLPYTIGTVNLAGRKSWITGWGYTSDYCGQWLFGRTAKERASRMPVVEWNDLSTISVYIVRRQPSDSNVIPTDLKYGQVEVMSNPQCSRALGGIQILASQICTAYNGQGSCNGDSGGALAIKTASGFVQIGIVSFGLERCAGTPTVFTRVSSHLAWIRKVTAL